eukprot:jgi/Tetstr1/424244/TSEL_001437.t1
MVVQRHLSRAIRLRDFVALDLSFQRTGAAASRLDTLRLYSACGPGSLSLFQSDHESARKIPHAAYAAAAARVLGLCPRGADRSRPSDLTLAGWGGAACDYMIDFACVSSTTPTWSNDPRCIPGIAATEAEHAKLAADRASSAPVQGVHRYYPFVVEDRGRLGKSALTVVYIFAVLLAVRNFPGGPSAPTSCFLRGQSVQALRNFVAGQPAEFRRHLSRTRRGLLQRVSACVRGTLGGILSAGVQMAKSDACARAHSASSHVTASTPQSM